MRHAVLSLTLLGIAAYAFLGWDVTRQLIRLDELRVRSPIPQYRPTYPQQPGEAQLVKDLREADEKLMAFKTRLQLLAALLLPAVILVVIASVGVFRRAIPGWAGAFLLLLPPVALAAPDFKPMIFVFQSPIILAGVLALFVRRPAELTPPVSPPPGGCHSCHTKLKGASVYTTNCCSKSLCEGCYADYCKTVATVTKMGGVCQCLFCPHVIDDVEGSLRG